MRFCASDVPSLNVVQRLGDPASASSLFNSHKKTSFLIMQLARASVAETRLARYFLAN